MQQSVMLIVLVVLYSVQFASAQTSLSVVPDTIEMKQSVKLVLLVVLYGAQFARAQTVTDVTDIAAYPYAAYLEYGDGGSGNGAIISDTQVLTTISAVNPGPGVQISVYVGNAVRRAGTLFMSLSYQKHPQYNATNFDNDVGIVTINGTFAGLPNVQPIDIRTTAFTQNPVSCFVIGWGVFIFSSTSSAPMNRIQYQLVTDQDCATRLKPQPSTIQCASASKGTGLFEAGSLPLVCDNQLYGLLIKYEYSFSDAQPIDIFTKLVAPSIQDFLFPKASVAQSSQRRNYVSCN
ncbi:trypsin delta-like [Anopheles aquasalis]|uniref:trypsin delta-like n=1 Tax=Anopheles aquasalis TaxID=42839 RepID=UPI00215A5D11|nr:trypsin delta-like [Anopheles aquasalis]